jgi:hypothetical protein
MGTKVSGPGWPLLRSQEPSESMAHLIIHEVNNEVDGLLAIR